MDGEISFALQVFDPGGEWAIVERQLPHWQQPGTVCFVTFRTWDSVPRAVVEQWAQERDAWLAAHGCPVGCGDWKAAAAKLPWRARREFLQIFSNRWQDELDACRGACVLRDSGLARLVGDAFERFDGDRYELTDYVVMPNHAHVLAAFREADGLLKQCESWKHYTAFRVNQQLGRKGRFWQQDGFDHLVRSMEQFEYLRDYIADNPRRAGLRDNEFLHYSKDLGPGSPRRRSRTGGGRA